MNSFEPRGRHTLESFASRNARTGQRSAAERSKNRRSRGFYRREPFCRLSCAASSAECSSCSALTRSAAPKKSVRQTLSIIEAGRKRPVGRCGALFGRYAARAMSLLPSVSGRAVADGRDFAVLADIFEADRHALRHARFLHRHAMQRVGRCHRALRMRNDDELRPGEKFMQHADESLGIGLVEGRIDFVEHAKRAGPAAEDREQQARRRSASFRRRSRARYSAAPCREAGR